MRQAIQTKYFGPGNVRGARIIATCEGHRMIVSWDHAIGYQENHAAGAKALAVKLGWTGDWIGGALPGCGYAFVMCDDNERAFGVS